MILLYLTQFIKKSFFNIIRIMSGSLEAVKAPICPSETLFQMFTEFWVCSVCNNNVCLSVKLLKCCCCGEDRTSNLRNWRSLLNHYIMLEDTFKRRLFYFEVLSKDSVKLDYVNKGDDSVVREFILKRTISQQQKKYTELCFKKQEELDDVYTKLAAKESQYSFLLENAKQQVLFSNEQSLCWANEKQTLQTTIKQLTAKNLELDAKYMQIVNEELSTYVTRSVESLNDILTLKTQVHDLSTSIAEAVILNPAEAATRIQKRGVRNCRDEGNRKRQKIN